MFLHDTYNDWAFQVHMYAYAHNSKPFSELNVSPHEFVFHTHPEYHLLLIYTLTEKPLNNVFPNIALNF